MYSKLESLGNGIKVKQLKKINFSSILIYKCRIILNHRIYGLIWNCLLIQDLFNVTCTMLIDFLSRPVCSFFTFLYFLN